MRIHFRLNHVHDACCHIIKYFNEPGLALITRWGHVDFNKPQSKIFVNEKVKSVELKRVPSALYHFSHLGQGPLHYSVHLRQEIIFPGHILVLFWVQLVQVIDKVIAAQHELVVSLDAEV